MHFLESFSKIFSFVFRTIMGSVLNSLWNVIAARKKIYQEERWVETWKMINSLLDLSKFILKQPVFFFSSNILTFTRLLRFIISISFSWYFSFENGDLFHSKTLLMSIPSAVWFAMYKYVHLFKKMWPLLRAPFNWKANSNLLTGSKT